MVADRPGPVKKRVHSGSGVFSAEAAVYESVTELVRSLSQRIPLLVRSGGCGVKKISAKPTLAPQTGWSLTQHIEENAFSETDLVSDHAGRSSRGGFAAFP
jgi:hypothetical protein